MLQNIMTLQATPFYVALSLFSGSRLFWEDKTEGGVKLEDFINILISNKEYLQGVRL